MDVNRMSRLPRWMHWLYAWLGGYFWLPCPLCGRYSGGHEWRDINGLPSSIPGDRPGTSHGICPACTRAGRGYEVVRVWYPVLDDAELPGVGRGAFRSQP
jgi:hypothetical protein